MFFMQGHSFAFIPRGNLTFHAICPSRSGEKRGFCDPVFHEMLWCEGEKCLVCVYFYIWGFHKSPPPKFSNENTHLKETKCVKTQNINRHCCHERLADTKKDVLHEGVHVWTFHFFVAPVVSCRPNKARARARGESQQRLKSLSGELGRLLLCMLFYQL